jgi:O-antigen ligase
LSLSSILPAFTFFLIPFLGGNHLPIHFVTIDRFWIESTFVLFLTVSMLLAYLRNHGKLPGSRGFLLLYLPYLAINGISVLYTYSLFNTLSTLNVLAWSLGSVYLYMSSDRKDMLLKALVLGALALSLCAFMQYLFLFPALRNVFRVGKYASLLREQSGIPFSSYIYHNILGGYLLLVLPMALYFGVIKRNVLYILASSVILTALIFSSTRIGMGLSLLTCLICLALALKRRQMKDLMILSVIITCTGLLTFGFIHGVKETRDADVRHALKDKAKTAYTQLRTMNTRTEIWREGIKAFRAKPIQGFGAGAFEYAYREYSDGTNQTLFAHSALIKMAVETGILGLAAFLFYCIAAFSGIRKRAGAIKFQMVGLSVLWAVLFGLLDFSFDVSSHVVTFFVLTSVFLAPQRAGGDKSGFLQPSNAMGVSDTACHRGRKAVAPAIILLLLIISFFFTVRANLSRESTAKGSLAEEVGMITEAFTLYKDAIQELPVNNGGYIGAVDILVRSYANEAGPEKKELIKEGIQHYLRRMERKRDKDSELYLMMAKGYEACGDLGPAGNYFAKAIAYFPSSAYYTSEAARFFLIQGKVEKSREIIGSYRPYMDKFRDARNPKGIFIYKIRDLESEVELRSGNKGTALRIARENLQDARDEVYLISSARSKEFVTRSDLLKYLEGRVRLLENRVADL